VVFILRLKFFKGWGVNLRGDQLKREKESLFELQDLEILEEI
jgi:hypothetical protein